MTFLSPWTALIAAAAALPVLLLLYFLKLRRQTLRIPSTLLWKQSFEDLQVNAPFQRLRWSALLALQLLMLLLLLAALAEPLWRGGEARSSRVVIIIDRSASMNAPVLDELPQEDGRPPVTRLDAAKRAATDIIDSLGSRGGRSGPSQAMIIAFGSTAQVVSTFESNRGVLRDALDSIQPTDEESNLEAALQLAAAFAGSRDELSAGDADAPPEVVLLSDGGVAGASQAFALRAGEFRFVQVARDSATAAPLPIDNLGIVALGARRDYEDPARVIVFARLLNASPNPIDAIVTLSLDGAAAATIRRSVPATTADASGEATLSHALDLPGGAVITLQHNHADQLAADDVAALVLPPPAQPRIAMVYGSTPGAVADVGDKNQAPGPDPFLHELLSSTEPQRLDVVTIDAWNQIDAAAIDSGSRYDLVVFDRVSNHRLPGIPSLTFGGVPAGVRETHPASDGDHAGGPILSWDRQHPVLRNLSLDSILYSGFGALDLPQSTATPLAFGRDGPIIALVRTRGARHLIVGFAMRKSNWPVHVSSAMFVQNAVEFLTLAASGSSAGSGGAGLVYRPGETISLRAAPDARSIIVEGGSAKVDVPVEPGAPVTLPAFRRAGIYRAAGAMPPSNIIAVSVLSDVESDIRPRDSITVNARASEALNATTQQPLPLWPWLLAAALALAVIEWIVYCRRVA